MPKLGKGTECIKLMLTQVSSDMQEAIVPMIFPVLGAHVSGAEFQYPDRTWKEMCGMLAHLVAVSGMGKNQLTPLITAACRSFKAHDDAEFAKLADYTRTIKTKGEKQSRPVEPEIAIWNPPSDVTNPAFLKNAISCEKFGGHSQYYNLPEVEMADQMCGGHKKVSQMLRNIFDRQRHGALRATVDGVTGNPLLRANITISSTPFSARRFYKTELYNGTFGRVTFSYRPRLKREGRIPRQGTYDEDFLSQLDEYLLRLDACKGRFVIQKLNKLADRLASDMAELADLTDNDDLWDVSKRSIVEAWKCGCLLYILNGQSWTSAMGELVEWLVYNDLWSKMQVFSDMLKEGDLSIADAGKSGPKNMLNDLPNEFTLAEIEALRLSLGKPQDAKNQLRVWSHRGFITFDAERNLYLKTAAYLQK